MLPADEVPLAVNVAMSLTPSRIGSLPGAGTPASTAGSPSRVPKSVSRKLSVNRSGPDSRRSNSRPPRYPRLQLRLMVVVGLRRRDRQVRLQLEEVLLSHAAYIHQLLDLLERSVLLPVLDDAFGGLGADAGKRLQLGDRCGVDVDGSGDGGLRRRTAAAPALGSGRLRLRRNQRREGDDRQNGTQHTQSSF